MDIPLLLHLSRLFGPLITRENLCRVFELDQEWGELSILYQSLKLREAELKLYCDKCAPDDYIGKGWQLNEYEKERLKKWWKFGELGYELPEHQLPGDCNIGDVSSRCLLPARSGKEVLMDFDAYLHDLEEKRALHEHELQGEDAIGMGVGRDDEVRVRGGRQNAYYQFGSLCKFKPKAGSREVTLLQYSGPRGLLGTS